MKTIYRGIKKNSKFRMYYAFPRFLLDEEVNANSKITYTMLLQELRSNRFKNKENVDQDLNGQKKVYVYCSQKKLAEKIQVSVPSIKRYFAELKEAGLIETVQNEVGELQKIYLLYKLKQKNDLNYGRPFYITPETEVVDYIKFPDFLNILSILPMAKIVYLLLLERSEMSQNKGTKWADEDGWIFVHYTISSLGSKIHRKESVVNEYLRELRKNGLIETQQINKKGPSKIYVLIEDWCITENGRKSNDESVFISQLLAEFISNEKGLDEEPFSDESDEFENIWLNDDILPF